MHAKELIGKHINTEWGGWIVVEGYSRYGTETWSHFRKHPTTWEQLGLNNNMMYVPLRRMLRWAAWSAADVVPEEYLDKTQGLYLNPGRKAFRSARYMQSWDLCPELKGTRAYIGVSADYWALERNL